MVWILITGLVARSRLDGVRPLLRQYQSAVTAGDVPRARHLGDAIAARADSAHQLTSGPAWWVGSNVLGLGTPLRTARVISLDVDILAHDALPQLSELTAHTSSGHTGASGGRIDVDYVRGIGTRTTRIRGVVEQITATLQATPASWLGPVSGGRAAALAKLHSIDADLAGAQRAVHTIVPMLGAERPQRYFIGFMNEAESRSIGGLPGAFAIVTVDDGHAEVEHVGSDLELANVRADVDLGAEYDRLYGQDDPAGVIQNSDIGPSFPDAARIWAGMWQAKTGQHVDGALAIDPTALGYLLRATGPAHLPDGTAVTATNVAGLTQSRQYVLYPGYLPEQKERRKQYLATIAQAAARKVLDAGSVSGFVAPLRQALRERRIVLWSDDASRERAIVRAGIGGTLDPGVRPFSAFFVNNSTGSKLDFYLHRRATYRSTGCAAGRAATASLTLDNDTPTYRLPAYVTYVAGGRPAGTKAGWNRLIVSYYATPGSRITSVTLDGATQHLIPATEDGLTSIRLDVALPAGASRTLTVVTTEPATTGPVQVVAQPLVYALKQSVSAPSCDAAAPGAGGGVDLSTLVIAGLIVLAVVEGSVVVTRRRRGRRRTARMSP